METNEMIDHTESSDLQQRMIRYAKHHGMQAYAACIDQDTIVVIVPWVDAQGNHGSDQVYCYTWQDLRATLGY